MEATQGRISNLRRYAVSSFAALGAWVSGPVLAADTAAATEQPALQEVVVTAEYREEKLQDVPIAITAITGQDIELRSFTDSWQIGYTVPNASFRPAQAAFGNTMTAYIRGVGQYDFDFAFEPGVGIYVDDVYQPFTLGTQMDLMDMERVEVLRGPQGTLFGRGSIGGVVRLISKRPEGNDSGFIDVTAGSYKRIDIRAGYDFKRLVESALRYLLSRNRRDGDRHVLKFLLAVLRGNDDLLDPRGGLRRRPRISSQGESAQQRAKRCTAA